MRENLTEIYNKYQKGVHFKMNLVKKSLLTFGATAALAGVFVANNTMTAEASGWEARTVQEVKEDVQTNGVETEYTIQWGDTLGTIANALDIPVDQIVNVNEIANRDLIIAGNILHLSKASDTVSVEDSQIHEVETYDLEEAETQEEAEAPEETAEAPEEPAEPEEASNEEAATEEPEAENTASETTTQTSGSEAEAKEWIAFKESTDNYNARNGQYIGKYQLSADYLDGDHSPENQERVAEEYVASRYGSWTAAKEFWLQNGWY